MKTMSLEQDCLSSNPGAATSELCDFERATSVWYLLCRAALIALNDEIHVKCLESTWPMGSTWSISVNTTCRIAYEWCVEIEGMASTSKELRNWLGRENICLGYVS